MIFDMKQQPPCDFKIPLETVLRHGFHIRGLPFIAGEGLSTESKANLHNRMHFIYQIASLRKGRVTRFAAVGALGTLVNLLMMSLLVHGLFRISYVVAAVIAAEISILHNFVLQERFVFQDIRGGISSWRERLGQHLLFNNAEALVRLPFLMLLVETMHVLAVFAQAVTLAIAFFARFIFMSRVVYRSKPVKGAARHRAPRERLKESSA